MWTQENFIGGHPALDFLNTVGDTGKSRAENRLTSVGDLCSWIRASGLGERVTVDPPPAQQDVEDLLRFRESAYSALCHIAKESKAADAHFPELEEYLKDALQGAILAASNTPAIWTASKTSSAYFLDSFVLLFDDLLHSPDFSRLRQCERCTWLFLNSGRGRGRRWCNMATCGNRDKVAAHRRRRAQGRIGQSPDT